LNVTLKTSDELAPVVERVLGRLFPLLKQLVPQAELHHIGATALSGALTKGDLDVLMHVDPPQFKAAASALNQHFEVKQKENWTAEFASFGDDTHYELPVGIQLMVKGSKDDFLLFLREYFIAHPEALAEYNRIKTATCEQGAKSYWAAKNVFLTKILASREV
jgi:GrpB-like predicted nucleotidyltransferase (UPF0157 family)